MRELFPNLQIDPLSFLSGFVVALITVWAVNRLQKNWPQARAYLKEQLDRSGKKSIADIKQRLLKEILKKAQANHLAAPLFSLDEIVIPPRIILPLPFTNPDEPTNYEDLIHPVVSYIPDWPELASHLCIPSLSMIDALQGKTNIAIIGHPGSGKTVALSWLAIQIGHDNQKNGNLSGLFPAFLHINDLEIINGKSKEAAAVIIQAMKAYLPGIFSSQISTFLKREIDEGRFLLILDGIDELSSTQVKELTKFLKVLLTENPKIRLIIAASPDYLDGLTSLNIFPLALAGWTKDDCSHYIKRWGNLWTELIEPINEGDNLETIDAYLLNAWLMDDSDFLSPFELTLKTWAAYGGDVFGNKATDLLDSFFRRNLPDPKILPALEAIAIDMLKANNLSLPHEQIATILEKFDVDLATLVGTGIIIRSTSGRIAFLHPIIMGYLAGQAINDPQTIAITVKQPAWAGRNLALHYSATCADLTDPIETMLSEDGLSLFFQNLFMIARWLRDVPVKTPWRNTVMRRLTEILKQESYPLSIRSRALAAFLNSNDPSVVLLLRQLLILNRPTSRLLAALGVGALQDQKSFHDLNGLLSDPDPFVQSAAGIALVTIGTPNILGPLKEALFRGDEALGRIIAIAIGSHPTLGKSTLEEWCTDENLLIRRFGVFGLELIPEKWSLEMLEKMSIEEGEWVVRNAAVQALENRQNYNLFIPKQLPDPHNVTWLINFASKQGKGISLSTSVTPMLMNAMETGTLEERQAALRYLSIIPDPDPSVIISIYRIAFAEKGVLRETAFHILWLMLVRGISLPSPIQYGIVLQQYS